MPALLEIRRRGIWQVDLIPHAYVEAGRVQLGAMPGIRWLPEKRCYRGPVEAAQIVAATLEAAGVYKVQWEAEYQRTFALDSSPVDGLRDYQLHGRTWAAWMLRYTRGALLADEMGLGKSAQALAAFDAALPAGRVAIICPAIVTHHWEAQITRWASRFGTRAELPEELPTRKAERAPVLEAQRRWIVMSHEVARARQAAGTFPDVDGMILDEIHAYSNPKSKRGAAMHEWRSAHLDTPILGLSGTPMTAYVRDMWSALELLHPGRWGTKWQFEKRYCNGHKEELQIGQQKRDIWVADGATNQAELATRLQAVMLRRTKADVALELPPLTRQIIEVDPQRILGIIDEAPEGDADRPCNDLTQEAARRSGAHIRDLLAQAEGTKLDAVLDLAREVIAGGGRPLVLTLRRSSAHYLASRLGVEPVTGDVATCERVATLQAEGAPCGVATLASVTTGIDLVAFNVVIMAGLDWVPSTMLQGEARAHRLNQTRAVTVYYLVALGTVDEAVREKVIDRLDTFAAITGGDATNGMGETLRGGSVDELLAGLAAQILGEAA